MQDLIPEDCSRRIVSLVLLKVTSINQVLTGGYFGRLSCDAMDLIATMGLVFQLEVASQVSGLSFLT